MQKINIAISGGPNTGKSTLAAYLFALLKNCDLECDLIGEEYRRLKKEMGDLESPFERFYLWRQQEREEKRCNAECGFITDTPLFHLTVSARMYAKTPKEEMAARELERIWLEVPKDRYQLIVLAKDPTEIPYRFDGTRIAGQKSAVHRHRLLVNFIGLNFEDSSVVWVDGDVFQRAGQVINRYCELLRKG